MFFGKFFNKSCCLQHINKIVIVNVPTHQNQNNNNNNDGEKIRLMTLQKNWGDIIGDILIEFCLLVSTHVVCERLSVMHYTFQLPEFLVQNSMSAPTQVFQECWSEPSPHPSTFENADLDRS